MKHLKKITAVLLSVLMLFSFSSAALAFEETDRDAPVIYIPGFTSSNVYDDISNPDTLARFPSTEDILSIVTEAFIPSLIAFSVDKDTDKLVCRVTDRVNEVFAYWFNEPTGSAKEGSGIVPEVLTEVSADARLTFSYDWRGDPVEIADSLHAYIETVCQLSGCEKITLGCHSLGSTIALAYLTKYGNGRVSAMVFDSPACNGVALVGNIFTGKVNLDADGIAFYLSALMGESEYNELVTSFVDILASAGVLGLFNSFADEIIAALAPAVYRETVAPLLGCWPTMWSMVPDEDMEKAKEHIFGEILAGKDYSVLEGKIDNYNDTVRANRTETLKSFDEEGNFAIFSRYTTQTVPLKDYAHLLSDQIIETESTSFGATTAPIGEYFSDEYLEGKDMALISPDKTVDASTCLFPEKTWFIKASGHFETDGVTKELYDIFLFADEEITCDSGALSRFTIRDDSFILVEDTTAPEGNKDNGIVARMYRFITALFRTVALLIEKYL